MDETFLYQQIAETIRRDILEGKLKPGDRLPSVRQLREQWGCTTGTVQRAYNALAREGLLISRAGRGTQVAGSIPQSRAQAQSTLRRANLVHHSETFLLEALTAGYDLNEIQQALDMAMDRWRALDADHRAGLDAPALEVLRFYGSHDLALNDLAHTVFGRVIPGVVLQLNYTGSLGGLIALSEGRADLAGCHLWDEATNTYNLPYIRRLLPGVEVCVTTLAHRRQGLILAPGNPHKIQGLVDLTRPGVRFVNRQPGSGTRVWLDATLRRMAIQPEQIAGFEDERLTHSEVARVVAEGGADAGLGLETAALAYGLDFIFLTRERYDLVMLAQTAGRPPVRALLDWLSSGEGRQFIERHRGYDGQSTGQVVSLDEEKNA